MCELHFYEVKQKKYSKKSEIVEVEKQMPRLEKFKLTATMLDIKKQIAKKYEVFMKNNEGLDSDELINENITIQIENNLPLVMKGRYSKVRADCEFC